MRDLSKRDQRAPVALLDQLRDSSAHLALGLYAQRPRVRAGIHRSDRVERTDGQRPCPSPRRCPSCACRGRTRCCARAPSTSTAPCETRRAALGFDYSLLAASTPCRKVSARSLEMSKLMNGGMGLAEARKATANAKARRSHNGGASSGQHADRRRGLGSVRALSGAPRLLTTVPPTTAARRYNTLSYLEGILWTAGRTSMASARLRLGVRLRHRPPRAPSRAPPAVARPRDQGHPGGISTLTEQQALLAPVVASPSSARCRGELRWKLSEMAPGRALDVDALFEDFYLLRDAGDGGVGRCRRRGRNGQRESGQRAVSPPAGVGARRTSAGDLLVRARAWAAPSFSGA